MGDHTEPQLDSYSISGKNVLSESDDGIPILLITANVGSLFEDPDRLLNPWVEEFKRMVSEDATPPQFLALHLQEVGGKTYEKSMACVEEFIRKLCETEELRDYTVIRIFMDEDFNSAEHFTALGNLYFVLNSVEDPKIWNFLIHDWEIAEGKNIYTGNIETIATKEKAKFPQHFFPECKWSRKGYMRTRWELYGTVFDLVNIHLFHDASNLAACEQFPSVYCKTRRKALVHTLERFHVDGKNLLVPYFLFGDFNFRCDTEGVIKELTQNLTVHRIQNFKNDSTKVHYRNSLGNNVLTIGKKEFNHADHQLKFKESWLKKFDRELEVLNEVLVEYPIEFPPSYPYEEDPEMPTDYMSTRCPAWCDRILMSPHAKQIIVDEDPHLSYGLIGETTCMGDHKPIYLRVRLKQNQGTCRCCFCYVTNANNSALKFLRDDQRNSSYNFSKNTMSYSGKHFNFCPYQSHAYNAILVECKKLINNNILLQNTKLSHSFDSETAADLRSHNGSVLERGEKDNKCPVSINIIDSDNLYVCICSQIVSNNNEKEGSICSHCQNIIKKQSGEHRYRLITKRLVLSDDIIVNRIDTQYLNAHLDIRRLRDPYTPESIESHSPCPELNSSLSTTSSSNSRSPFEQLLTTNLEGHATLRNKETNEFQLSSSKNIHQRGIFTPGQLLSRLEDLQRSSLRVSSNHNNDDCTVYMCDSYLSDTNDNNGTDNEEDQCVVGICKTCMPHCCNAQ